MERTSTNFRVEKENAKISRLSFNKFKVVTKLFFSFSFSLHHAHLSFYRTDKFLLFFLVVSRYPKASRIILSNSEQRVKSRDFIEYTKLPTRRRDSFFVFPPPVSSTRVLLLLYRVRLYVFLDGHVHIDDAQQTTIVACSSSES